MWRLQSDLILRDGVIRVMLLVGDEIFSGVYKIIYTNVILPCSKHMQKS